MSSASQRVAGSLFALLAFAGLGCSSREVVVEGTGPTAEQRARMSPTEKVFDAAKRGDVATLKAVIAADPNLVNAKDNQGQTPLHYTAVCMNPEAVKFLVEKGADPLAKDLEERTPSMYATEMRARPGVSKALGDAANAAAMAKRAKPAVTE